MRKVRPFRAVLIQHGRQFRKRRPFRDRRVPIGRIGMWLALAALVGGVAGYFSAQGSSIRELTARLLPDKSFRRRPTPGPIMPIATRHAPQAGRRSRPTSRATALTSMPTATAQLASPIPGIIRAA
jgi:hypothetical protein